MSSRHNSNSNWQTRRPSTGVKSKAESEASILKGYSGFDMRPVQEWLDEKSQEPMRRKQLAVMLSGPPGSGKSFVGKWLESRLIGTAGITYPSQSLYACMSVCSLRETSNSYEAFKALPFGRQRLITAANYLRAKEEDLFSILALRQIGWTLDLPIAIVDNAGFEAEIQFFPKRADKTILLEIQRPFHPCKNPPEAEWERIARTGGIWPGDSRHSLAGSYGKSFAADPDHCLLTFRDSASAITTLTAMLDMPLKSVHPLHLKLDNDSHRKAAGFMRDAVQYFHNN